MTWKDALRLPKLSIAVGALIVWVTIIAYTTNTIQEQQRRSNAPKVPQSAQSLTENPSASAPAHSRFANAPTAKTTEDTHRAATVTKTALRTLIVDRAMAGEAAAMYELYHVLRTEDPHGNAGTAHEWLVAAADAGHNEARYTLGSQYAARDKSENLHARGLGYLLRATEEGHESATVLYVAYTIDSPQTDAKLREYYRKLAAITTPELRGKARCIMGYMVERGQGRLQNSEHALALYQESQQCAKHGLSDYAARAVTRLQAQTALVSYRSATIEPTSKQTTPRRYVPQAENGDYYNMDNDGDGRREPVYVRGYYRKDGTYVRGHYRASPSR